MRSGIVGTSSIPREVLTQLQGWGISPSALCGTSRSRSSGASSGRSTPGIPVYSQSWTICEAIDYARNIHCP